MLSLSILFCIFHADIPSTKLGRQRYITNTYRNKVSSEQCEAHISITLNSTVKNYVSIMANTNTWIRTCLDDKREEFSI